MTKLYNHTGEKLRLFRNVQPGTLPGGKDVVAVYRADDNLVLIDPVLFALLSKNQQRTIEQTKSALTLIARDKHGDIHLVSYRTMPVAAQREAA